MLFFGNRLRLAAILSRRPHPPLRNSENPTSKKVLLPISIDSNTLME